MLELLRACVLVEVDGVREDGMEEETGSGRLLCTGSGR
jgi:hypothetical protein